MFNARNCFRLLIYLAHLSVRCSKGLVMVTQCSTRVASIICIRPNKKNKCFSGQVSEILGRVGTHIFF